MENAEGVAPTVMFGEQVRRLRMERGLSQMELAQRSDVHRTYISSLENGHRNVALNLIYRLADGLGVRVTEFFPQD